MRCVSCVVGAARTSGWSIETVLTRVAAGAEDVGVVVAEQAARTPGFSTKGHIRMCSVRSQLTRRHILRKRGRAGRLCQ